VIYRAIGVEFDEQLIEKIPLHKLPPDWQDDPVTSGTRAIGDKWARSGRSAILEVPSVLIPSESNFLLNPEHPNFKRLRIAKPKPFAFDPRLLK